MAIPNHSSISIACRAIADFVKDEIDIGEDTINVSLGNPENVETGDKHSINLFFYRFKPSEFQADASPGETWMIRSYCLMTPFAVEEDNKSSGEIDLRLLGEVMRLFHDKPVQSVVIDDSDGESVQFQLQVIYKDLGLEALNQLWGTQGSVIYRPSLSYEIDLMPVIPAEKAIESPKVGAWGMESFADLDARYKTVSVSVNTPVVHYQKVNTNIESWAPAICFVHENECVQTLSFELESISLTNFEREVWLAGALDTDIDFYWEYWDSENGWHTLDSVDSRTIVSTTIDPENIYPGVLFTLTNPSFEKDGSTINLLEQQGQLVLYALRTYRRSSEGSTGSGYRALSNPLLISLYQNGA